MSCVNAHWRSAEWVDELLSKLKPIEAAEVPVARPGSLWVSVATKRRGCVLWASVDAVKLAFTDHASVVLSGEQLKRLYRPVL